MMLYRHRRGESGEPSLNFSCDGWFIGVCPTGLGMRWRRANLGRPARPMRGPWFFRVAPWGLRIAWWWRRG